MITTVCLNPAIDQNAEVTRLQIGGMNRLQNLQAFAAGKGINVAVVLSRLGVMARSIGFVGDADAWYFEHSMQQEGVLFQPVTVAGSVRRNLKLLELDCATVTELNQQGMITGAEALAELTSKLTKQSSIDEYCALCGSLPPGCPEDSYQTMMQTLPGRRWIVDASCAAMRHALKAKPYLIKPNKAELEEIAGRRLDSLEDIQNTAIALCQKGVRYTAVSLGGQGALITDGNRTVFAAALPVKASFTVGAGDSFLAGLLYGLDTGDDIFASLRCGIAAGAACVEGGGIRAFSPDRFHALLPQVEIKEL